MTRALELAERGLYTTTPNPRVGCVLVRDGRIIGEGWHQRAGGPHAEIHALADARARGADPRGATAYVTLEPCNHQGSTPPCTDALLAAGVGAGGRRDAPIRIRRQRTAPSGCARRAIEVDIGLLRGPCARAQSRAG